MPFRFSRPAWCVMLLVGATIVGAGCASNTQPGFVSIPELRIGDRATYAGTDGSTLSVEIKGSATRADPWLNLVPVILLEYRYQAPDASWSPYTFEESLDHAGRIVQQVALCGSPVHPDNDRGPCHDTRHAVHFGAWGWPGALGAGPAWRDGRLPQQLTFPAGHATGRDQIGIALTRGEAGCQNLSYAGPPLGISAMPFTLGNGEAKLCPASPFPASFGGSIDWMPAMSQRRDVDYTLLQATSGTDTLQLPSPAVAAAGKNQSLAFATFDDPLYKHNRPDALPFPTEEAIQAAAERSEVVRAFMSKYPAAIALTSIYTETGNSNGGPILGGDSQSASRTIHLADGSGPCQRVEIERTVRNASRLPLDSNDTFYELLDASSCGPAAVDVGNITRRQVTWEAAASLGERLTGLPPILRLAGYAHRERPVVWSDQDPRWLEDGYELNAFFADPEPQTTSSGLVLANHFDFRLDGPTGAIKVIQLPLEKMPLAGVLR